MSSTATATCASERIAARPRIGRGAVEGTAMEWVVIVAVVLAMSVFAAFRLGRTLPRRPAQQSLLSPVTQQHLHLFQGGRLSEAAVETAKARLRALLERGRVADAEASLRPGLQFAVHVQ